jgi:hypothetical protein
MPARYNPNPSSGFTLLLNDLTASLYAFKLPQRPGTVVAVKTLLIPSV